MAKGDKQDVKTEPAKGDVRIGGPVNEDLHRRLREAQWRLGEALNDVTTRVNRGLTNAQREWIRAQQNAQAAFLGDSDQQKLQAALNDAQRAYWDAVADVQTSTTKAFGDLRSEHWNALKSIIAEIGADALDQCTIGSVAQTLTVLGSTGTCA